MSHVHGTQPHQYTHTCTLMSVCTCTLISTPPVVPRMCTHLVGKSRLSLLSAAGMFQWRAMPRASHASASPASNGCNSVRLSQLL